MRSHQVGEIRGPSCKRKITLEVKFFLSWGRKAYCKSISLLPWNRQLTFCPPSPPAPSYEYASTVICFFTFRLCLPLLVATFVFLLCTSSIIKVMDKWQCCWFLALLWYFCHRGALWGCSKTITVALNFFWLCFISSCCLQSSDGRVLCAASSSGGI